MKVNGKMIKKMAKVIEHVQMDILMKESGKMVKKMVMEIVILIMLYLN